MRNQTTKYRRRQVLTQMTLAVPCAAVRFASAQGRAGGVSVETAALRLEIPPTGGGLRLTDKAAGVTWTSNPSRIGEVALQVHGKAERFDLRAFETGGTPDAPVLIFRPVAGRPDATLRINLKPAQNGQSLDFSYDADGVDVEEIRLLDTLTATGESAYILVPVREGLLIPAGSGRAFRMRFGTSDYEGCHMTMLGLVKDGAALLATWTDPYVVAEVTAGETEAQPLSASLLLRKSAKSAQLHVLGKGDYVSIAKAYREVAKSKGYLVTWDQKLKNHPERAGYFGASNVKLWHALNRRMNEESTEEVSVRVEWTFDEVAQIAEHLKRDLQIDKVLFGLGGWIRRGYDNQHPDILPAAPELGGNEGLADCARRVRAVGYLFSLHDNYQDIYRDSPSWDEQWIMKTREGKLAQGGRWAGGRAYLTCSQKALDLARRPQNLPAVRKLAGPNCYFIDTTYAAGLQECFDPKHPLTKLDDMKWKIALSEYAREVFGSFGSECGREWAIPHAEFFEGLTGVSGTYFANAKLLQQTGGFPVPLFEIVYRDCIAMYGKYAYDINRSAEYVLHHILIGRTLNYHRMPMHIYWKGADIAPDPTDPAGLFVRGANGWTEGLVAMDRYLKNTHEILSPLNEITSRLPMTRHEFLTADRRAQRSVFGENARAVESVVNMGAGTLPWNSKLGGRIDLPPYGFLVEAPSFVAFHARNWNGVTYASPPLFTLRSLDGRPLAESRRVRVYHGFGDAGLRLRGSDRSVVNEAVLEL